MNIIFFLLAAEFSTIPGHQVSYEHRSYKRNLSNCVEKPEKVRTSTGFELVICDDHSLLDFKLRSYI